jgi:hypothetical protein
VASFLRRKQPIKTGMMLAIQTKPSYAERLKCRMAALVQDLISIWTRYNSKEYSPHRERKEITGFVILLFSNHALTEEIATHSGGVIKMKGYQ